MDYVNDFNDLIVDGGPESHITVRNVSRSLSRHLRAAAADRAQEVGVIGEPERRWSVRADGFQQFGGGATAPDVAVYRDIANRLRMEAGDSFMVDGTWNGGMMLLGAYRLWVDAAGKLRMKSGNPTSDTDGTVVGTQA